MGVLPPGEKASIVSHTSILTCHLLYKLQSKNHAIVLDELEQIMHSSIMYETRNQKQEQQIAIVHLQTEITKVYLTLSPVKRYLHIH